VCAHVLLCAFSSRIGPAGRITHKSPNRLFIDPDRKQNRIERNAQKMFNQRAGEQSLSINIIQHTTVVSISVTINFIFLSSCFITSPITTVFVRVSYFLSFLLRDYRYRCLGIYFLVI